MTSAVVGGVAATVAARTSAIATEPRLSWRHFPAGETGFFRAPVLVSGPEEAVLIDGGFTLSDGAAVAKAIAATGKKLTTVYVSQSDPDYYFGLAPIKEAFPRARFVAAPAAIDAIRTSVVKKLATWGPQLKENGPQTLDAIVVPEAFEGHSLSVDGEALDIVEAEGLPNRRYVRAPSLEAVFGGVLSFSGVHVWTADTPDAAARQAWVRVLDAMAARDPKVVVAGHMTTDAATDASAIAFTRAYLLAFEDELAKSTKSGDLIAAMTRRYPDAEMGIALQIGAKVATGEMKWG